MTSSGGNQTTPTGAVRTTQTLTTTDTVTLTLTPPRYKKKKKKAVRWASDVIDNELMSKKSSKKCCIFHKRQVFGEWNDSDTDEEEECNCNSQETSTPR